MKPKKKKIAFIACVNNDMEFSEAKHYISRLRVPEGYETDVIAVRDAPSMTAGYNAAMESSDAQYKVYLHQDTFICNPNFILEMLQVFETDERIGMFGCIGCRQLPSNARAVGFYDIGKVYHNGIPYKVVRGWQAEGQAAEVEALDGLLLATKYDIRWREDLFDGWDFYDVSQCLEMKRAGYRVVVPYMQEPWCYHDCTYSKMANYQKYSQKIVEEYQDIKPFCVTEYRESKKEFDQIKDSSRKELQKFLMQGKKEELLSLFAEDEYRGYLHLREFETLADIVVSERQAGREIFWREEDTYETLMQKLSLLKFALKRMEFGAGEEESETDYIVSNYSMQAVRAVGRAYVVEKQDVWEKLLKKQ